MKKAICLVMAIVLCLGLCACGGNGNEENKTQSSNKDDVLTQMGIEPLGTYYSDGFYDDDNNLIKYTGNYPLIILEENNVAKVSLNPSSGKGFTFYYEINGVHLDLYSDFNLDGVPDTGADAVRAAGTFVYDGSFTLLWDDGLFQHYKK